MSEHDHPKYHHVYDQFMKVVWIVVIVIVLLGAAVAGIISKRRGGGKPSPPGSKLPLLVRSIEGLREQREKNAKLLAAKIQNVADAREAAAKAKAKLAQAAERLAREQRAASRRVRDWFSSWLNYGEKREVKFGLIPGQWSEVYQFPQDAHFRFNTSGDGDVYVRVSHDAWGESFRDVCYRVGMSKEDISRNDAALTGDIVRIKFMVREPGRQLTLLTWDQDVKLENCRFLN